MSVDDVETSESDGGDLSNRLVAPLNTPRLIADLGICLPLGRDFELILLAATPMAVQPSSADQTRGIQIEAGMAETGRVRFNGSAATTVMTAILRTLIREDLINTDALIEAIKSDVALASADEDVETPVADVESKW